MIIWLQVADEILRKWKKNPALTKRDLGYFASWMSGDEQNDWPLTQKELVYLKELLRVASPGRYFDIFPEEKGEQYVGGTVHRTFYLNFRAELIWEAMVNPDQMRNWMGEQVVVRNIKGREWLTLWQGDVFISNLEVLKGKKLKQLWYFDADKGRPTLVSIYLLGVDSDWSQINLEHRGISHEALPHVYRSWEDQYFSPLQNFLQKSRTEAGSQQS